MLELAPSSSSFCYKWRYEVFISFRGKDTRYGFTGYMNNALNKAGVHTFFDDEKIRRGDEITPTLLEAIENSRMAIIVFSKNYASSTFCLNELVKIHECIKMKGRLVLPIFYDVEPSEVRHQTGNYEHDLSEHMEDLRANENKIQSWKRALREVANICGHHIIAGNNRYEHQVIEDIVKEIFSKIKRVPFHICDYPIGLESRVKKITSLLQIESKEEAIMVGVCGMGGLGKSTIARALYNSIADNFEGSCFLNDVKEKSTKVGLEGIQEIIFSRILGVDIKIQDVNEGVEIMKRRFKEKKILLILDNVDNHNQLKKLAGDCNWFGCGSRIIMTTRDRHLLVRHGVESIYDMAGFNAMESLALLRWKAFGNSQVDPSFEEVLNRAATYAQGLPLALEVIGSNLRGKPTNEWESALDRYKLHPEICIQEVLKVSYEDLEQIEKEIFLDIACFFKGKTLKYVKYMVGAIYDSNNLSYSIGVLVDKCLIKIEGYGRDIEMHDLIRDMGRTIVREESTENPGECSRLWFQQDIVDVLEEKRGTDKVSMIIQDNSYERIKVDWDGKAFKNMKRLKMLYFKNVEFSESPKYLPNSLRVLQWKGYPYSSLPPKFHPKKLVVLDIGNSNLRSLETIKTYSTNLSVLNLSGCQNVTEIPDLWSLQNLKELRLTECENLTKIHDSIGSLANLEILDVGACCHLEIFPYAIRSPSLRVLDLSYCSSLKYFPEVLEKVKVRRLYLAFTGIEKLPDLSNLQNLKELLLSGCKNLTEIHDSIGNLENLEILDARWCGQLKILPSAIRSPFLRELQLYGCSSLKNFPEIVEKVKVRYLYLIGTGIEKLPGSICNLSELWSLKIDEGKSIMEIPNCIFLLPKLGSIEIEGKVKISCNSMESQQQPAIRLKKRNRHSVSLRNCDLTDNDIRTTHLHHWINVRELDLTGNNVTILPSWIKQCLSMRMLMLNDCKHLRDVEAIPPNIQILEATNCTSLSSDSKSLILSEELHGDPYRYTIGCYSSDRRSRHWFCVPSRNMPEWFEHRSKGASISLWFRRNSFLQILCLCFLFKPQDGVLYSNYQYPAPFRSRLFINGKEACSLDLDLDTFGYGTLKQFDDHHLVVYHLSRFHNYTLKQFDEHECNPEDDEIINSKLVRHEWLHVKVEVEHDDSVVIEESGMHAIGQLCDMMHVIGQLCDMQHISFHNPCESLDYTSSGPEQFDTRMMKEKEGPLYKKRRLIGGCDFASSSTMFHRSIINGDNNANEIINHKGCIKCDEGACSAKTLKAAEPNMEQAQGWKPNILKDPLQGIRGPMTRARTKAMKEALNCFIRDLKELEPNYIKDSSIHMSNKSPIKVVTMLEAQQVDIQGLSGVHVEEFT